MFSVEMQKVGNRVSLKYSLRESIKDLLAKFFNKLFRNLFNKSAVDRFIQEERGSASVEFVLLAIPLFLPILLFLNHFSTVSNSELVARTLVRESLRAYVTSPNNEVAPSRAWQVLTVGGRAEGLTESQISAMEISYQCSATPCISPNGRIRATLKMSLPRENRTVIAEAEEFISPWQFNGEGHGLQPSLTVEPGVVVDSVIGSLIDLVPPGLNYPLKFIAANL